MYITSVDITNIRSVTRFSMVFHKPEGWHVIIGDNGSGKSSIVRGIAATLIGPEQIGAVLPVWDEWLAYESNKGSIKLDLQRDSEWDKTSQTGICRSRFRLGSCNR